jgi:hypothetical protein
MRSDIATWSHSWRISDNKPIYKDVYGGSNMYIFMAQKRNRVQKRVAKFANNINESGWDTLAQRRLMARICALFKAYTGGRA